MESVVDVLYYIDGTHKVFIEGVTLWAPMALEFCVGADITKTTQWMECVTVDGELYEFMITGGYKL